MPMTLSGDGTITGLAAGGLPDATVTTAEIVDASVTAAKMSGAQSGSAPVYGARAWVNFNGTGTVAIRASGNVSSITDDGTGQYIVNFTVAMADANYSVGVNTDYDGVSFGVNAKNFATTSFLIQCILPNLSNYSDKAIVNASVFR
jgi:hypothetical protein